MTPTELDPEKITALILIHPAGITPEVEFLIDQYVLKGGTVIACIDAFSFVAEQSSGGNSLAAQQDQGTPTSSTLPTLLAGWGVKYSGSKIVADRKYATPLQDGRIGVALLNLPEDSMPQREDDLITKSLDNLYFIFSGGFTVEGGKGPATRSLVRTSKNTALVSSFQASRIDQSLLTSMGSADKAYDLVLHLSGNFNTAFPDGDPNAPAEKESEKPDDSATAETDSETEKEETPTAPPTLKKATKPGNVFLFADSDFIYDQFAFQPFQFGNTRMFSPTNGNSSLLLNVLDQATGSPHLIGSRSRASSRRPFTLIQEMESRSEQKTGEKEAELNKKLEEANQRLTALQSQLPEGSNILQDPQVQAEAKKFQLQIRENSKKIRELQKDLKKEKDALTATVISLNVLVVPILVAAIGIGVLGRRRLAAAAR